MRLAVAWLTFTALANCSPIGPFGMLTDATIDIPPNPNNTAVQLSMTSTYSQAFTMDVTGGIGPGYVEFSLDLSANHFDGSPYAEYMDSRSVISSTATMFGLQTIPWQPQGSTPADCYGADLGCLLPFTFGVAQDITFTASSIVSYSYNPIFAGSLPLLAGDTIQSSVTVGFVGAEDSLGNSVDATVTFTDAATPEPTTFLLIGAGLLLMWYPRTGRLRNARVIPAMEAGIADHVWSIEELTAA